MMNQKLIDEGKKIQKLCDKNVTKGFKCITIVSDADGAFTYNCAKETNVNILVGLLFRAAIHSNGHIMIGRANL